MSLTYNFNLPLYLFLKPDSYVLYVKSMSHTEVSSESVWPVPLIDSDPFFAVTNADIDQEQRDTQLQLLLFLLGGR